MTQAFENGYAVVIGVDDNNIKNLALPTVAKDVRAVYDVLIHPERCAYQAANVRLLSGADSTRANILAALDWLRAKASADPDATAVLYYSGHGAAESGRYYLIPFDINYGTIYTDAIPAEEFNSRISATNARRLLVVFDCCHAGGVGARDSGLESLDNESEDLPIAAEAFPIDLAAAGLPEYDGEAAGRSLMGGLESAGDLLEGEGRAVLNSSTGAQKSYLLQDRTMSLFTYHFIEALTGHAPHNDDDTTVLVTDVMSWVAREVKKSAAREGRNQTPVMRTSGVFPIAQLLGGKGLAKGLGEVAPDPLETLPPVSPATDSDRYLSDLHAQIHQSFDLEEIRTLSFDLGVDFDDVAGEGKGARIRELLLQLARRGELQALLDRVRAARPRAGWTDVPAGFILPGGLASPEKERQPNYNTFVPAVTINQPYQTADGDANIGHLGDAVRGDKIEGDSIHVGDISGSSGVAIGRGASATVTTMTGGAASGGLFGALRALVMQRAPPLASKVAELQTQVGRGASADDTTVAGLIDDLARGVPGAGALLSELMGSPEAAPAAGGPATKFVLGRL